jgi:hypothetical protein
VALQPLPIVRVPASFPSQVSLTVAYGQASVVTYQYPTENESAGLP